MKVMLIHNRYRSAAPSGENRVVDRESAALISGGHEVTKFERDSDELEHWPALKKATLPSRVIWNRDAHHGLRAALRSRRPDVVHVHNTFPLLSPAVLYACREAAVPVVATIHNYRLACASADFFRNGAVCHDCAMGLPIHGMLRGCYRGSRLATAPVALSMSAHRRAWRSFVSAYIFISASQRDLLAGLGFPQDRTFVKYHLIPHVGAPKLAGEPYVIYVGRLDEQKGVRLLMSGWDDYLSKSGKSGLRLLIVGAGPLDEDVATWASALPSVDVVGQVGGDRCAELMSRARAVLLPSALEEPFGLVVVEAMALGVPPIAAGHGSFTELVTPGVDGALFRPGEPAALSAAIADAEAHPQRYESYGARARLTYEERFDPDQNLQQLLEIYRFAIGRPAGFMRDAGREHIAIAEESPPDDGAIAPGWRAEDVARTRD